MDIQSLTNLHVALKAHGFMGNMEILSELLSTAKDETQERFFVSYWKKSGTPEQATLVANMITHAHKHRMKLSYNVHIPEHLILVNRRYDHAIRIGTLELDLVEKSVRLVFFKDAKFFGERNICFKNRNLAARVSQG